MNLRISIANIVFDAFASGMTTIKVNVDYNGECREMKICAGESEDRIHIFSDNSIKLTLTWETIFMLSKSYARSIPITLACPGDEINGVFVESSFTNEIEVF